MSEIAKVIDLPHEAIPSWTRKQREEYLAASVQYRARWEGVHMDTERFGRHPDDVEQPNEEED